MRVSAAVLVWPLLAACLPAAAQAPGAGVYTCVDAKGRRLSADRPIDECMDREQRVLSPSGLVVRTVRPQPTAAEIEAQQAAEREQALVRQRQEQSRRRDTLLLTRYPDRAAYERARERALSTQAVGAPNAPGASIEQLRERLDDELRRLESLWAEQARLR